MTPMKWISVVLGVLGLLALVVAIIYFSVPAHSLPTFLGPLNRVQAHRKRRGEAAIALAVVLGVIAGIVYLRRQAVEGDPRAGRDRPGRKLTDASCPPHSRSGRASRQRRYRSGSRGDTGAHPRGIAACYPYCVGG